MAAAAGAVTGRAGAAACDEPALPYRQAGDDAACHEAQRRQRARAT